jgi:hypothetical protein
MKKLMCFLLVFIQFAYLNARENTDLKSGNQKVSEKEKENAILEKIHSMLEDTTFVFNATDMMVRGGGNVNLGYDCDVQVNKEIVVSYLPFMGKAYSVSTDIENSGFDFTLPMQDYYYTERKSGYKAGFKVKNGSDHMNFTFFITKTGYTTLTVGSSRRQSISFYGTFNARK